METKEPSDNMATSQKIWQDLYPSLNVFVRSRVHEDADAEDLLQDIFLKIHTNLHTVKQQNRTQAWAFQIARNTINDFYRRKRLVVGTSKTDIPEIKDDAGKHEMEDCMLPFLLRLPEKYREALVLAELRNVPQNTLARKLKISYSGAKSRVQRARQMLLSYFRACCHIKTDKYGNILSHTPKGKCLCAA